MKLRSAIFFKTILLFMIFITTLLLIRSIKPNVPLLRESFSLCNLGNLESWSILSETKPLFYKSVSLEGGRPFFEIIYPKESSGSIFSCKTLIPVQKLYEAKTINIELITNQKINFKIGIFRRGGSPPLGKPATVEPSFKDEIRTITFYLDSKEGPKINWLTGDYDEIRFEWSNPNLEENLTIQILNVSLR